MNTKTFFDKLPATLAADPKLGTGINAVFHLKVRGTGGGEWTLNCRGPSPRLEVGLAGKADCAVEADAADFESVLRDPASAMRLYIAKRVKIEGNALLITKLAPILKAVK